MTIRNPEGAIAAGKKFLASQGIADVDFEGHRERWWNWFFDEQMLVVWFSKEDSLYRLGIMEKSSVLFKKSIFKHVVVKSRTLILG